MITSPTNSINTARDLENMIDSYRGQITIQEQTILQNKKMLTAQEYTIGQNELKNKELETFIDTKTADLKNLNSNLENLEKSQQDLIENIKKRTKYFI